MTATGMTFVSITDLHVAASRCNTISESSAALGRKTARERLASFLLMVSRRAAARGRPDSPIELPMSRADIGDYLGLTTETVSRTFTQLKKQGTIGLPSQSKVDILKREELEEIAEAG